MIFFQMMKIVAMSILFIALSACNKDELDADQLNQLIISGNEIVVAVEAYKELRDSLPESLDELVSIKLLQSIPESGIEGNRFRYVRFNPVEKLEYRVTVRLSKPSVLLLSDSSSTELTFRIDGKYETNNVEVHKLIEGWAVQTVYK
jgi:hypothetical protein